MVIVIYSQHSDCTMQQLYLFTYHWMYIFSTCHTLATFRLHDAVVILVYLPLDVYIFYLSYIHNIRTVQCSSYTCLLTIGCIYFLLVIYSQHSDCMMQQLYLFTYHSINIFSTRHILATFRLHDAVVVLVYLLLDLYIFYSSYIHNIQTARCSSYTCLLTIGCIYFLLVIYSQHSDCTMQQLYWFTYHWMYIFSTCHLFATFGLHDAAVILVYLPLDVYMFYSSYIHNIQTA